MDIIGLLKDWGFVIGGVVIPLVAHNVRLQMAVNRMNKVLDPDKVNEFNADWAVHKERQSETREDVKRVKEDIRDIYRRMERQ